MGTWQNQNRMQIQLGTDRAVELFFEQILKRLVVVVVARGWSDARRFRFVDKVVHLVSCGGCGAFAASGTVGCCGGVGGGIGARHACALCVGGGG